MTLDAYPDSETLLRLKAEREGRRRGPSVAPGPTIPRADSPDPAPRPPGRPPGRPRQRGGRRAREHERAVQVALFAWADDPARQAVHPELALLYHVPNGGCRTPRAAGRLKAEGVRPGVPDVVLPVPRGGYGALYVELKVPGGSTSPAQADWLYQLARVGNRTALVTTLEAAQRAVLDYLSLPSRP